MSRLISFYIVLVILLFLSLDGCKKRSLVNVVNTNGEEIHFSNKGDGDISLLFIHGFGNNQSIWEGQISHFSNRYRVIAVDLPGFGLSSHNRLDWTMENYGKDIAGLIHELKLKKVVLIGFSMGAPVAVEAAKILDEELLGLVLVDQIKDINLNFPPEAVEGISAFIFDLLANPSEEKLVKGGFIKQNTSETYQNVLKMIQETSSNEAWNDILANTFNWVNEKDEAALKTIKIPVTIINADYEPTNSEQLKSIIPYLNIEIVKDSGHCIFWDFPQEFNALVEKSVQRFSK